MSDQRKILVVGAGPAGLTAANELCRAGLKPVVLERAHTVGGIARTESHEGNHFDIGGHRFFTKVEQVERLWEEMLGEDFISVQRLSRIYYRGNFFNYPLDIGNTLSNLGVKESLHILLSFLYARARPSSKETTFEEWVTNRFGHRLYETFFKTYTEKVWGIPCSQIQAEWAAQRIRGLSLLSAVKNALLGGNDVKSLIHEFKYPRRGPGMMWKRFTKRIREAGGQVLINSPVEQIQWEGNRVVRVRSRDDGALRQRDVDWVISSMPATSLVRMLNPAPPESVIEAARQLSYRSFIIVGLTLNQTDVFPDQWIYVHSPAVRVGRIQNFKNWSSAMVADPATTTLGMEYFCSEGDETWRLADHELVALARKEVVDLKLVSGDVVRGGVVIRQPKAYPVYDADYRRHLQVIREYLDRFSNLQTVGRNGMHRYNNQDHSMLTGILAARNVLGESHDIWDVNTERSYYEEFTVEESSRTSKP